MLWPSRFRRQLDDSLEVCLIASTGRSGSTLLRNELAKCDALTCLDSPGSIIWLRENHDLLINDPNDVFRRRYPEMRRYFEKRELYRNDIRYQFSRSWLDRRTGRTLKKRLIIKDALFMVGAIHPRIFCNMNVIHVIRSPLAFAR